MKRLLAHESLAHVGHLRNLLEQSGFPCLIKNEQLSGGLGEIPFLDCLPELWVIDDEQLADAQTLLREAQGSSSSMQQWRCRHCDALNDGQFAACWHCSAADESDH